MFGLLYPAENSTLSPYLLSTLSGEVGRERTLGLNGIGRSWSVTSISGPYKTLHILRTYDVYHQREATMKILLLLSIVCVILVTKAEEEEVVGGFVDLDEMAQRDSGVGGVDVLVKRDELDAYDLLKVKVPWNKIESGRPDFGPGGFDYIGKREDDK
ncbi:uncharacterized protein [Ptychodera flava]|uniref:uncharacterized protein n=1 Tax=Ptychodera flava TaxID=63121 RepID=UPI00396A3C86